MNPTEQIVAVATCLLHAMRSQTDPTSGRPPGELAAGAPSGDEPHLAPVTPLATPAAPHVQVRTVAHHTPQGQSHDVACSSCGIIATRTLAETAEEDASQHREHGWHHSLYPGRRPGPEGATVIPLRPAATQENP